MNHYGDVIRYFTYNNLSLPMNWDMLTDKERQLKKAKLSEADYNNKPGEVLCK